MKFVLAIIVHVLLGLFLMWGMIQAVQGNWWILIASCVVYLAIFTRAGCASH
jgi:hypothetical protein